MAFRHATMENETEDEATQLGILLSSLQERMQQRLASDLHDSTCQHLVAASLHLLRLRNAASAIAGTEKICDEIDASIDEALRELRAFAYLLHPQGLLADGLKTTIEQFVDGFSTRTSLKVSLEIAAEIDSLPQETQRSLLNVIQEALSNVFRHAKATGVQIIVQATDTDFLLRIRDDGRGMPIDEKRIQLGVGIPGMRARLRQMGGAIEFHSSSAGECSGTTLCAAIPRFVRAPSQRFQTRFVRKSNRQQHTGESVADGRGHSDGLIYPRQRPASSAKRKRKNRATTARADSDQV